MKHAVITGASRRLGLYLTEKLIEQGVHVFAITRNRGSKLDALPESHVTQIEVADYQPQYVEKLIAGIRAKTESIDLLVNNASMFEKDALLKDAITDYQSLFNVHMAFPAMLSEQLFRLLAAAGDGGNIINVTDIFVANPNPAFSLYCSTKAGLDNLTLSQAKNFAPKVRVNSIRPGPVKFLPEHQQADKSQVLSETLLSFESGFEPIWQTVQFILANQYLTGEHIKVDGGRSLKRG